MTSEHKEYEINLEKSLVKVTLQQKTVPSFEDLLFKPGLTVYILKLKEGKYYIGTSLNAATTIKAHFTGKGGKWTKLYPPKRIIQIQVAKQKETLFQNICNNMVGKM